MNFIEGTIFILFLAILSVPLATKLRIPLEIFLFLGSCIVGFLPGVAGFQLNSDIVFGLFLPPILFYAAYFTSWQDFKFNLRPILQLAFGLVIFTTAIVAVVVKEFLLPQLSWPEAFLLGAIISPTDASAATAIVKKFNVPRRFLIVLEGESLINDATALMLYRFSLAAILYGTFSSSKLVGKFFVVSVGGIFIGLIVALLATTILKRIKHTHAETTFTFITAFSSYLIAEHFGCSGVVSTVTAGIYFGIHFPELATSRTKLNAKASWDTLIFIINGFVFTLIGLEWPVVLENLQSYSVSELIIYGSVLTIVVMAIRLIWIFPSAYLPRALFPSIKKKDPMPPAKLLFALGWVGMRGIVSLAAALAIPRHNLPAGFAQHVNLIIFLVYFVVVATLIVPAITLPILIRMLGLSNADELEEKMHQEAKARLNALDEITKTITTMKENENIPEQVFQEFVKQIQRKHKVIQTQLNPAPYSLLQDDYLIYKKLLFAAIRAERNALMNLRRQGEIHDEIFWSLSNELDIEEVRANTLRASGV